MPNFAMKKNESAFIMISIIGFVLKLSLVAIGHWIMLIGLALLANSYFIGLDGILKGKGYQQFLEERKNTKSKIYILLPSYAITIILIGLLFSIMTWPGASPMLLGGVIMSVIAIYFITAKADEDKQWKMGALKRVIIYGAIGLVFYLLPQYTWFDIIYRQNPDYREAAKEFYADPENEALRAKMEEEYNKMKNGI